MHQTSAVHGPPAATLPAHPLLSELCYGLVALLQACWSQEICTQLACSLQSGLLLERQ